MAKSAQSQMAVLRRLAQRELSDADASLFVSIVNEMENACKNVEDPTLNNPAHQDILENCGIFECLLDMIHFVPQPTAVLNAAFGLLTALVRRNKKHQGLLANRVEEILGCHGQSTGWENSMARVIEEIFDSNQDTCLSVTPEQIENMVTIVAKHQFTVYSMLDALRAVAKVEDLNIPIQRNQNLIVKYLTARRQTVIDIAFIDVEGDAEVNQLRLELLRSKSTKGTEYEKRQYHLNLVSLLASCCEGKNQFIESVCQTIFSLKELKDTLADAAIESSAKCSYLRFLLWCYFNTEGSGYGTGVSELPSDVNFFISVADIVQLELDACYQSGDNAPNSVSMLNRVFDAVLPFVSKVAENYYNAKQYPATVKPMEDIAVSVASFATRALPQIFDRAQVKSISYCVSELSKVAPSKFGNSLKASLGMKLNSQDAGISESPAEARCRTHYSEELAVNEALNAFVKNVGVAYRGRNTIRDQIGIFATKSGSALLGDNDALNAPYSEAEGSDEAFTLGPEFQAMVNVFAVHDNHTGVPIAITQDLEMVVRAFEASQRLASTTGSAERERNIIVDKKLMMVVRAILHNATKLSGTCLELQNRVVSSGIVLEIAGMLSYNSDGLVRETLALLCAILEGGNNLAQKAFEEHFLGTREETFFDDVLGRIRQSSIAIREFRVLEKQKADEKARQAEMSGTLTIAAKFVDKKMLRSNESFVRLRDETRTSMSGDLDIKSDALKAGGQSTSFTAENVIQETTGGMMDNMVRSCHSLSSLLILTLPSLTCI